MPAIRRFEDLEIWIEARRLANEIFLISEQTKLKNDYRFKDQIRASSGSIMDNTAEGFERNGNIEFRQFLSVAKGSAGETRSQLYRVYDCGYITEIEFLRIRTEYEKLSGRLNNFIIYLNRKDFKGTKFIASQP